MLRSRRRERASLTRYDDNFTEVRWSQGSPTASESGTRAGVFLGGDHPSFTFRLPIDATPRRLTLYTNTYRSRSRFTASIDGGNAPSAATREVDAPGGDAWGRTTIDVHAVTPGQLVVVFELLSTPGGGNIALAAATLR